MDDSTAQPRSPDVQIAGFSLWVFGREFEDLHDYSDGNWLRVFARCSAGRSTVEAKGPIIHAPELAKWLKELRECNSSLNGEAVLACMEPNLSARIWLKDGRGEFILNITPDHVSQEHRYTFQIDQSYLRELIFGLEDVLKRFPIRNDS